MTAVTLERGLPPWHLSRCGHMCPSCSLSSEPLLWVHSQRSPRLPAFSPSSLPPFPPLLYKQSYSQQETSLVSLFLPSSSSLLISQEQPVRGTLLCPLRSA